LKAEHLQQGEDAEKACSDYLGKQGLKLVEHNFRSRQGEIDLIMLDKNMLVFIEVRYRKSNSFGGGLESVTPAKQKRLRRTAELYLQQNTRYKNARFDVVSMTKNNQTNGNSQQYSFDWVSNAF
jgi:putative endonuclease